MARYISFVAASSVGNDPRVLMDHPVQAFYGIGNRHEDLGAIIRPYHTRKGICCEHPGQRHWEHEGAGRLIYSMSFELELYQPP